MKKRQSWDEKSLIRRKTCQIYYLSFEEKAIMEWKISHSMKGLSWKKYVIWRQSNDGMKDLSLGESPVSKGQIHIKYKFIPDYRPWHVDIRDTFIFWFWGHFQKHRAFLLRILVIFLSNLCTPNIKSLCSGYQISSPLISKFGFDDKR